MGWILALHPKIFRRFDKSSPKILLPKPIDCHASGQGMIWIDQPFGQAEAISRRSRWEWRQNGGNAWRNLVTFLVVFAADQDKCVARFRGFFCDQRGWDRLF